MPEPTLWQRAARPVRRWFAGRRRARAIADFHAYCRRHWPARAGSGGPLLLIHRSSWYPSLLNYAFAANFTAGPLGARLASFGFSPRDETLAPLYAAFGAADLLGLATLPNFRPAAEELAATIFTTLRTKRDVVDIAIDGIALGDLIYDTHLRQHFRKTVELDDPEFRPTLQRVLEIYLASRDFLDRHEVAMVFTDHAVYAEAGVLSRLALARGIPVHHVPYNPATLIPLDPVLWDGQPGDPTGRAVGRGSAKLILPYHRFAELFAALAPAEQTRQRTLARATLEARLAGAFDPGVLPGGSAYAPATGPRLLAASGRPAILITLHDFCDAPHAFRDLLFPDHYEWTCWLLDRASQTPFDWYVKPHPNIVAHDPKKAAVNESVVAELRARFPKIHFLPPSASNRQLIDEGVAALFTGYGTAGHEFAWFGVPAVNAGDNPHINFTFTHNPRSIAELAALVDRADSLQVPPDAHEQIERYAALRYVYYADAGGHPIRFLPKGFEDSPENFRRLQDPEILGLACDVTEKQFAAARDYFEELLASGRHRLP